MSTIFKQSKWIWANDSFSCDDYAQFIDNFSSHNQKVILRLSCDTVYALYLNNKLIKFMLCSDFPEDKFYDEVPLLINNGVNELRIDVWHYGKDFHSAVKAEHGLIYEIIDEDDNVITYSHEKIKSRIINEFKNGYQKIITEQQGFSFYFDNTVNRSSFQESIIVNRKCQYTNRLIHNIELLNRLPIKLIKKEESIIVDLGKETAGFVDLDFISQEEQEILFYYGEHLKVEGHVLKGYEGANFSFEYKAKKGRNVFLNPLKRIAGRYIEIYSNKNITINYIGIRPVSYARKIIKYQYDDPLINKINEICLRLTAFPSSTEEIQEYAVDNVVTSIKNYKVTETNSAAWSYRALNKFALLETDYANKAVAIDFKPETESASFEIDYMSDSNTYVGKKIYISVTNYVPTSTFGKLTEKGDGWYTLTVSGLNLCATSRVSNGNINGIYIATDYAMSGSVTIDYGSFRAVDDIAPDRVEQVVDSTHEGISIWGGSVSDTMTVGQFRGDYELLVSVKVDGDVGTTVTANFANNGDSGGQKIFASITLTVTENGLSTSVGRIRKAIDDGWYDLIIRANEVDANVLASADPNSYLNVFWCNNTTMTIRSITFDLNSGHIYAPGILG